MTEAEQIKILRSADLMTATEHKAALARIDALMSAKLGTPEGDELSALVDRVTDYEALYEAGHALTIHMRATNFVRRDPKLADEYLKRAEVCVRAWLKARQRSFRDE